MQRYLVTHYGSDPPALKRSFAQVLDLCEAQGYSLLTLVFLQDENFLSSPFALFLGTNFSRTLASGGRVVLSDRLAMESTTPAALSRITPLDLVWGVFLTAPDLESLDCRTNIRGLAYLPWADEANDWLAQCAPIRLGEKPVSPTRPLIDPLVEQALLQLTAAIPMPVGLKHGFARELATDMLQKLIRQGRDPIPRELKKWAIAHKWPPEQANLLACLAGRLKK